MEHINKFTSSQDVQDALDNEVLGNPYIALVNGALDYNTLEPTPPIYIQDSSGNKYYPTQNQNVFNFNFTMDVLDSWALYDGGSIAIGTFDGELNRYCNGELVETEGVLQSDTPEQMEFNFGGYSYDEPDGTVIVTYEKYDDYNYATFEMRITYCGGGSSSASS